MKRSIQAGEIPGVQWPEPDVGNPAASQAVVFPAEPEPERCVNCGKCPRCGR